MRRIAINTHDGIPHDAYVYYFSFNRSHLVYVVRVIYTTQQRLQYQLSKASPRRNLSSIRGVVEYRVF